MKQVSLEEARKVHRTFVIVDGHNDTTVERVHRGEAPLNWHVRDEAYDTDVPRMREGGIDTNFFIVGNGVTANVHVTIERTLASIEAHPDMLLQVTKSRHVMEAHDSKRLGVLMAIEGGARWLNGAVDMVNHFYRLGVRSLGITHGEGGPEPHFLQHEPSPFAACTPAERNAARNAGKGLTDFGRDVVHRSNALCMITDLAHVSDRGFYQALELSSRPLTMTHTAVCSLCPHWRCMTDDQIKALASHGGVMGIAFAPFFLDSKAASASVEHIVRHIAYVADLVGIDHVAIGSDYDGLPAGVKPVPPDPTHFVHITRAMMAHGFSDDDMAKVWGGNFLRLFSQTIDR